MPYETFEMHYDRILAALRARAARPTSIDDDYGELLTEYILNGMVYGPHLKGFARWLREWARRN